MKRIKEACLLQTIHFQLKEDLDHASAVQAVRAEVEHYKAQLDRSRIQYKITDEAEQPDGSIPVSYTHLKACWDCRFLSGFISVPP